jgi:hypothetical protein
LDLLKKICLNQTKISFKEEEMSLKFLSDFSQRLDKKSDKVIVTFPLVAEGWPLRIEASELQLHCRIIRGNNLGFK